VKNEGLKAKHWVITVQMRQIVYIAEYVLRVIRELLQTKFKDAKRNVLVFATVVLHERCSHKYVEA
jgi:hypothetical protein